MEVKQWRDIPHDSPLYERVQSWAIRQDLALKEIPLGGFVRFGDGGCEVEIFIMENDRPVIVQNDVATRWTPVSSFPPLEALVETVRCVPATPASLIEEDA